MNDLTTTTIFVVCLQILEAAAFLNEDGIVHRDIKPSNGTSHSSLLLLSLFMDLTNFFLTSFDSHVQEQYRLGEH